MKPEKIFDLIVLLLILAGGLVTAYVSFGILSSAAQGQFAKYSFSGAFAGAIISWAALTSVYLQLRGSNKEIDELRARNEELQHKLIRGAPKPEGFTIEVDERQRIVLARPEEWEPKGGVIFDLELSDQKMKKSDAVSPSFQCYFQPIEPESTREAWIAKQLKDLDDAIVRGLVDSYTTEMVPVGSQLTGVDESLKIIVRQFTLTRFERSAITGNLERVWSIIPKHDFTGYLRLSLPENVSSNRSTQVTLRGRALRQGGSCYVGDRKVDSKVNQDGTEAVITVMADDINFRHQVEIEWENPDTHGLRSNILVLGVDNKYVAEEQAATDVTSKPLEEEIAQNADDVQSETPMQHNDGKDETREIFQQVIRMRVLCYNEPLKRIYSFDFFDDAQDFNESSAVFNRILNSVRFLD